MQQLWSHPGITTYTPYRTARSLDCLDPLQNVPHIMDTVIDQWDSFIVPRPVRGKKFFGLLQQYRQPLKFIPRHLAPTPFIMYYP